MDPRIRVAVIGLLFCFALTFSKVSGSPGKDSSRRTRHNGSSEMRSNEAVVQQPGPPLSADKESSNELIRVQLKPVNETRDISFYHAVAASFSVIIVSELGDKTWFIATIMAMRHSRVTVFCGAMSALALMTALSAGLGWATQIIPRALTYYISTALFALFGLKMLHEGWHMSNCEGQEEYEVAQAEVHKKELLRDTNKVADMESGGVTITVNKNSTYAIMSFVSTLFLEAFTLTFLAEWGDRSQLTTIILAARENVYGVLLGGIAGHAVCTGIAVIGGKLVATQISVRTVTLIGGVVFILFALSAFVIKPE